MAIPDPTHAKTRGRVRLPDGREGVLFYTPPLAAYQDRGGVAYSSRAKVRLDSGAFISCDPETLETIDA